MAQERDAYTGPFTALIDRGEERGCVDLKEVDAWMDGRSRLSTGVLTATRPARDASEVFDVRARRLLHG